MSRKSLADRIRESGENTQAELDKSRQLADRLIFFEKEPSENVSDKVTGNVSNNVTGKISDKVSSKVSDTVVKSLVKSLVKPVIISQENQQKKNDLPTSSDMVPEPDLSHKGITLSEKQFTVYMVLAEYENEGFIQATHISYDTGINIHTVRKILLVFREKGIIKYKRYQKNGRKGIIYNLNPEVKIDPGFNIENMLPAEKSVVKSLVKSVILNSSSSSLYKEPATPPDPSGKSDPDIESILQTDPEFGYWRQKNLTVRQIKQWMKTAGCGPHSVMEYLRYCRFEMSDLDMENTRPVENVFNWFFRILEKSGAYPRPKDYRSFTEKQLENERRFAQEQEKQIQELRTLRQKKIQQEQDKAFEEMMNDPNGDLYKKCFENLTDFHRKRAAKKGKTFETAMRKEFEKITEEDRPA